MRYHTSCVTIPSISAAGLCSRPKLDQFRVFILEHLLAKSLHLVSSARMLQFADDCDGRHNKNKVIYLAETSLGWFTDSSHRVHENKDRKIDPRLYSDNDQRAECISHRLVIM
ncbi:hypothetical protein T265_00917 [Opisthorchis viverrini]|uniref:Uncharacterized protein n=1 Tax=Opisthorchis viverrini TaxID=6198 RepID=A0A075ABN5_OPIVI|nr:hypothetical protein T265_00917 [Opisthorchis viverrini]KER33230.1 hypothetical protein T265_00917 [Opisthorchis viverrini]